MIAGMSIVGRWGRRRRGSASVASGLAVVLTVAVLGQAPAVAAPQQTPDWHLKPQVDRAVPARSIPPADAPAEMATQAPPPPAPRWPSAGIADATMPSYGLRRTGGTSIKPGGLGVTVGHPATAPQRAGTGGSPSEVRVEVFDQARAGAAGVRGVLLRLARTDGQTAPGRARVTVDYSAFRHAYGADWALRLRLVQLPSCALTSPLAAGCTGTVLVTANDHRAGTVSADVDIAATDQSAPVGTKALLAGDTPAPRTTGTLVAVAAGPASGAGSYKATTLQPSSTWSAGGNSGSFNWSYPMRVPPSRGGPAPKIELSYSSQSVDGRMAASNNQPSWIGEGFEWAPGYIERRYRPCHEDMTGGNNTVKTGDLCWARDNATMSLNGSSDELLFKGGVEWRSRNDDATRIQRVLNTANGDADGESWVVTTPDGTRYFFGSTLYGTWSVPVFGNHVNEPCHAATFAASHCSQAWRWMLDKVIDPDGHTMTLQWGRELNEYARNNTPSARASYVRGGFLQHIDYGGRDGVAGTAPMRVVFTTADRCVTTTCATHSAANWPDTPWDQQCTAAPCTIGSPTFWTIKRLSKVTTLLWVSGTTYREVEAWTLSHSFPSPGDGTRAGLWLDRISHSGKIGATTTVVPDITFGRVQMPNRVDSTQGDWAAAMKWWRISQIRTETGGSINVTYSNVDCSAPGGLPTADHTNTKLCYPVKWIPEGRTTPVTDWFHKYTVDTVTESDLTGGSPPVSTSYEYLGGAAWHYTDDDGLIDDDDKTWSVWRGFDTVRTIKGSTPQPQEITKVRYFRGLHGDKNSAGGTRTVTLPAIGSYAPAVADEDEFAGMTRETITYNGSDEVTGVVSEPWRSEPTATRMIGEVTVHARHTGVAKTWNRTALSSGGHRITGTVTEFDDYGLPEKVDDLGVLNLPGDERCMLNTYEPRNTTAWLVSLQHRQRTFSVACAKATGGATLTADDVMGDTRTSYDGAAYGIAPKKGNATTVEELKTWTPGPGGGTPGYVVTSTAKYDAYGRIIENTDVRNNTTATTYTPNAAGQLASTTVTNHLGWRTITTLDPAWGVTTKTQDPNDRVTEQTYDGLGRVTAVWLPGRAKATQTASMTFTYWVRVTAPTTVTTAKLISGNRYVTTHAIFDGLLRPRQTQAPEATTEGGRIITDTLHDSAGRVVKTRGPWYVTGAPSTLLVVPVSETSIPAVTTNVFDGAGRVSHAIFTSIGVEKWRTSTVYGGDRATVTPPPGGTKSETIADARGNTIELRQYRAYTGSAHDATTYTYNRKSQLTRVTDPATNHWDYTYDLRSRVTTTVDPDKGTTTSTYNDAGDIISTTNANGDVLAYTYDTLGRKTTIRDDSPTGPKRAEWVYDTLGNGSVVKGQLTKSIRYEPPGSANAYTTETAGFNADYTPTATTVTIPPVQGGLAGSYTQGFTYWEDGSPATVGMPDADGPGGLTSESLSYRYNHLGLPDTLRTQYGGADTGYVVGTTYTRFGEPTVIGLGSGPTGIDQARYYEEGARRLNRIITSRLTSPSGIADVNYTYDPAGNVTKIADLTSTPADTQCFTYDHVRRLTEAWTPQSSDCTSPTLAGLGGPAPYWHSWTFDVVGNRTTQVEHGATETRRSYTYPAPGSPRPHALTRVTSTGGATGTANYSYDPAGNTLSRPAPTSGGQTLTWDPEGHLASSDDPSGETTFVYGADGNRLIRTDPTGKTLYLPGQEVRFTTAGATRSTTRYYAWNGATIASRVATGLTWLVSDRQGTASHSIENAAGQAITTRRQTPYGGPRGAAATWPNPHGFVDGTNDNTGLTHLGAREYDPLIGRFVSVDPVMDLKDPQQMHGYTYGSNNPTTHADPTGLYFTRDEGGGGGTGTPAPTTPTPNPTPKKKKGLWNKITDVGGGAVKGWQEMIIAPSAAIVDFTVGGYNTVTSNFEAAYRGDISWGSAALNTYGFVAQANLAAATSPYTVGKAAVTEGAAAIKAAKRGDWEAVGYHGYKSAYNAGELASMFIGGGGGAANALKLGPKGRPRVPPHVNCNSFVPGTAVLLADGGTMPIEQLRIGDRVVATDPESGRTEAKEVVATIEGQGDKGLVELTIDVDGDRGDATASVTATDGHPFWVVELQDWVEAVNIHPGQWLRTAAGTWVQVAAVRHWTESTYAHNLTVADIHTYYVMVGGRPVLVHNCGGKATVTWEGGHASIDVELNGQVVSTHRWGGPGTGTEPDYFNGAISPSARRYEVDLPDAAAAQRYQRDTVGAEQGPYHRETNSCLTYCGDVLRNGGLDVPAASTGVGILLVRNGRKVG